MCGICGKVYFDRTRSVEKQVIANMVKSMFHRGPDGGGIYISGHVCLGHRRLAIIDLDAGKQPLSNEDGQVWITYNGEIYNYKELRSELQNRGHVFKTKTDTEVILHLYEDIGEQCLAKLRGMFAFALWDNRKRKLFLARDRVGIKPLYYTVSKDSLIFASEIKSLLQDPSVKAIINPTGIHSFLTCTYTPGPETVFQNIFKLQPGHYLVLEDSQILIKQYWDIYPYYLAKDTNAKQNDIESALMALLQETVKIHMISDVPVGFLLSGGVDSTAMLNFYQENLTSDIKTFTIGFEDQEFEDERKYARIAAKRYGVEYHEMTISSTQFFDFLPKYIWFMEEPIFEPPGVSLFFITQMAREHVKVLISGEGGDEAFAGYQTYRNIVWFERMKRILGPVRNSIGNVLSHSRGLIDDYLGEKYVSLMNMSFEEYYYSRAGSPASLFNANFDHLYSPEFRDRVKRNDLTRLFSEHIRNICDESKLKKMLYVDTKTWLPDRLLLKADKMTMANSLELRVPLLDHKVLEFAASLPDNQKLNGFRTKYIFKKILTNRVPNEIIRRKKAGFPTPYSQWLRENKNCVLEVLLDRKTNERGYFEERSIWDLLIKEWMQTGKYSMEIFNLLTLELWHKIFIDGDYGTVVK
jgi:asparagine synthase (glutamine-hydrolysing)